MDQGHESGASKEELERVHADAIAVMSVLYDALTTEGKEIHLAPVLFKGTEVTGVHLVEGGETYLLAIAVTPGMHESLSAVEVREAGAGDASETQNNDHT